MSWRRSADDSARGASSLVLAALIAVAVIVSVPRVANAHPQGAAHPPTSAPARSAPAQGGAATGSAGHDPAATQPSSTSSQPAGSGAVASAPDVTEQLGGTDPLCAHPAGLSAQAKANCEGSGSPQSPFPAGNYTPDTHIDTGLDRSGKRHRLGDPERDRARVRAVRDRDPRRPAGGLVGVRV